MTHLMNTYNRLPVAFTHGKGARLYDAEGVIRAGFAKRFARDTKL